MHYDIIKDRHLGIFTAPVPSTATQYLRYKVRLHFWDQTVGDTEWGTLLLNITANEEIQFSNNDNSNNNSNNNAQAMTVFKLIIVIVFCCILLLLNMLYNISKSQCTVWFNKKF